MLHHLASETNYERYKVVVLLDIVKAFDRINLPSESTSKKSIVVSARLVSESSVVLQAQYGHRLVRGTALSGHEMATIVCLVWIAAVAMKYVPLLDVGYAGTDRKPCRNGHRYLVAMNEYRRRSM
ncbi:hypothetical protein EVAR_59052_1 [Eumeta japonica]|uniref:Uncharacterized protein n=1 Tax=Eumeta variegata TaxID=151549 RepID=A0A4C1YCS8_EUMVA|nr:hypothetical protein EVAR_59052_1 [Eumeta japonica]